MITFVHLFTNVNRYGREGGRAEGERVGRGGSREGGKSGAGAGVGLLLQGWGCCVERNLVRLFA